MDTKFIILIGLTVVGISTATYFLLKYFKQPKEERLFGEHVTSLSRGRAILFLTLGVGHLYQWHSGSANKIGLYIAIVSILFGIYCLITSWHKNDS